ncbi:MAG: hypothetical protein J7621_20660 [Niastella sp.]|nr:hypothetical protein [Niastella sp.]
MKNSTALIAGMILAIAICSCKKGDTGPEGPKGADGINGNANVVQYTFGAQNLATTNFVTLQITTTKDTMDKCAWFVYLYYQTNDRWYFLPGPGVGGATQYRLNMGYSSNKVNIYIDKSGAGENYAQAKVVRILTNNTLPGGRVAAGAKPLPDIDFTDYEAVRNYYQLPR